MIARQGSPVLRRYFAGREAAIKRSGDRWRDHMGVAVPSSAEARRLPANELHDRAFEMDMQHDRGQGGQGSKNDNDADSQEKH
ncbi:MAG: hypothetical protein ACJ8AI_02005 [Rhodopila sp.]